MATTSGEMTAHPLVESYLDEEDANLPWLVPSLMNSICFDSMHDCNCCVHVCCIDLMGILGCLIGLAGTVGVTVEDNDAD